MEDILNEVWMALSQSPSSRHEPTVAPVPLQDVSMVGIVFSKERAIRVYVVSAHPLEIFIIQQLFLWLHNVVLDLFYWIYEKYFDFACSFKLF